MSSFLGRTQVHKKVLGARETFTQCKKKKKKKKKKKFTRLLSSPKGRVIGPPPARKVVIPSKSNPPPLALLALLLSGAYHTTARDIFVSPAGTGTGTLDAPYGSIQSAVGAAVAGDTIFLRGGTYAPTANVQIAKSGTRTQPITVRAYPGEKVVVDGENMPGTPKALDEALPNSERGIFHFRERMLKCP
ncbi:hypothetical protein CCUS01_14058 [Colletotrichum cuscutae]|uniref:Pectate lyase n=1 Tax=Colletotrichum cuscutae TaxID=1209917 RepID=A0AAI9YA35_9PEZI|nr:hypothetical protein CCUS01_14058 [Colletotrichum cuscutae]